MSCGLANPAFEANRNGGSEVESRQLRRQEQCVIIVILGHERDKQEDLELVSKAFFH